MYDYFIIGQGIAGSVLGYLLHKAGQKVLIIDPGKKNASVVAGALINPITGKRLTKTWLADLLIPCAFQFYRSLEKTFSASFFRELLITRVFSSIYQANDWDSKRLNPAFAEYISGASATTDLNLVEMNFGFTDFKKGAHIDAELLLSAFKKYFNQNGILNSTLFDTLSTPTSAPFSHDAQKAKNIIFCDGWRTAKNPLFSNLPFLPSKGDVFTLDIPNVHLDRIISKGLFMIPLNSGLVKSGSTYRWDSLTETADADGYATLKPKLDRLMTVKYDIFHHEAGIRPTVQDRRPVLGCHPNYKNVFIFNGLGTKGFLLAPFFAEQMWEYILYGCPIMADVNIARFYKKN